MSKKPTRVVAKPDTAVPTEISLTVTLRRYDAATGRTPMHLRTECFQLTAEGESWEVDQVIPPSAIQITHRVKGQADVVYVLNLKEAVLALAGSGK